MTWPEKLKSVALCHLSAVSTGCSSHSRPPSVREQLAAAAAAGGTVVVVPSPQPGCPRSLFGRLGIRKPSLLSLTSPHSHNNHPTAASATARTFSLDDLLKPPARSKASPKAPVLFFEKRNEGRSSLAAYMFLLDWCGYASLLSIKHTVHFEAFQRTAPCSLHSWIVTPIVYNRRNKVSC